MGEFDDVLAVELGDEWDAGEDRQGADHPHELVATLRLPGALVELRGEVPPPVRAALEPLTDEAVHTDSPALVTVVVERDGPTWTVTAPSGARRAEGARADDLSAALFRVLDELLVATDPARLHLEVACVELNGVGIAVVADRREVRTAVADELVRLGALPVTQRLLTVLPGSHTVFGYPLPASPGSAATSRPWRPFTVVDVVAHVAEGSGGSAPAELLPLPSSESCLRLVDVAVDRERLGSATLDVVASLVTDASHWEVVGGPAAVAAALRAVPPPPRRAFAVLHRFDEVAEGASIRDLHEAPSLRVARFEDGAVALDARTGKALSLTADEVEALEDLLVERPGSRRRPPPDERLARLAAQGMHVPDQRVRRPVPGTEAFGLPNCPVGTTAREMWAERPGEREQDRAPDGTTALAVLQGVVPGDEESHRSAIEVHRRVQEEVVDVERQLLHTLSLLAAAGIEPIVLGTVVQAHDGPLPPYFAESEEIDLLVHDGELATAVRALEQAGYSRRDGVPVVDDLRGIVDLVAASGFGEPVRLRDTLGVGPFGALVDHEEFHRRAVPVRIHGRWCRTLHPEHRFVHACLQLELEEDGSSTQHVRDVVLAAPRADALMAEAMEASERWGATSTVTKAVRRVDDLLPGLSPWIVERAHRPDAVPEGERRRGSGRRARRTVRRR